MSDKKEDKRIILGSHYWLAYVIPILLFVVLSALGFFKSLDARTSDIVYQHGKILNPNIYVIGIDQPTLSKYGKFDVWGREKMADLINVLSEDPDNAPAIIGIDVGIFGYKDSQTDQALVDAVRKAGNVVLVESASVGNVINKESDDSFSADREVVAMEEPFPELKEAALDVGHSNLFLDSDGTARHALGSFNYKGSTIPSFSYEIFRQYTGREDERFNEPGGRFYISYSGEPGDYYGSLTSGCSFKDVVEGTYPKEAFRDSIVLVGAYATGMQDNYYPSIKHSTQIHGVEIHANVIAQMIEGTYITELADPNIALITAVAGILALVLFIFAPIALSIPCSLWLAFLYVLGAKGLYMNHGILLPILAPVLLIVFLCTIHILVHSARAVEEKRRTVERFSRYLAPEVAKRVSDISISEAWPVKEEDIAVMYVDIHSFTTMSEQVGPSIVEVLHQFFDTVLESAFKYEGTCDKMIGDCAMLLFGAPMKVEDYEYKAVKAALDIKRKMESGAVMIDTGDGPRPITVGMGIGCGKVFCGEMGSKTYRVEYTALGDPVNVASRLEGLTSDNEILISESLIERVGDRFITEYKGSYHLKGKLGKTKVYSVLREK